MPPQGFRCDCTDNVRWHDASAERGHSNFQFVDEHYESQHTVRRIFSLARKLGFNSFCTESISPSSSLLQEEDECLRTRNCGFLRSEVTRISFFRTTLENAEQGIFASEEYLGYAVIKKDICNPTDNSQLYVYESVLPTYRDEKANNFLHCHRRYQVQYPFGTFSVVGSLYAQQNGLTFVCAHVALRSVLSLVLNEGDISYTEINHLAGISTSNGDTGLGKGMSDTQLEKVLQKKNIAYRKIIHEPAAPKYVNKPIFSFCILCEFLYALCSKIFLFISRKEKERIIDEGQCKQSIRRDYSRHLYGFIEANCPSLLLFQTQDSAHVVPVIGHTFNEDMWVPDADDYFSKKQYFSSERWLSTFLIHDDNYGPYLCLPKNYLDGKSVAIYGLGQDTKSLCFDGVEITALERLIWFANAIPFQKDVDWYDKFVTFAHNKMLVLRPVFIDRHSYLRQLQNIPDTITTRLVTNLPEVFWVVEVSFPELFSATRAKIGDVILICKNVRKDFSANIIPLFLRLPGFVYFEGEDQIIPFDCDCHVRQLKNY